MREISKLGKPLYLVHCVLGKPQKKVLFLSGPTTKGEGGKSPTTKQKGTLKFFFFLFVAVEKSNLFCLRRHVEILILVY